MKKSFDDTDIIVAENDLKNEILSRTLVGTRIDKKPHESTLINIGEVDNKKIIIQANITSNKIVNISEEVKVDSDISYKYIKENKVIGTSYETPAIVKYMSLSELNKTKQTVFSPDDIRYIIKNKLYPEAVLNKIVLQNKTDDDLIYVDQTDKKQATIIKIKQQISILKSIINHELEKGNIIYQPVLEYNILQEELDKMLTKDELNSITWLTTSAQLNESKKTIIIDIKKNIKVLQIYDLQDVMNNTELYKKIYENQWKHIEVIDKILKKLK